MATSEPIGPRILMLGSECAFSAIVLRRLIEHGADVCGFVVRDPHPGPRAFEPSHREIPIVVGDMGPAAALEAGVTVIQAASTHDLDALERARTLEPDIVLVACFPMILDVAWIGLARGMCLNLHPSLLPSYRGPTPLFWQFRGGERETGITLHLVEPGIDAGHVVAQSAMPLPAGARFSEINAELAETGAELVLDLLDRVRADVGIPRTAQDESLASYQPFPRETDFRFDTHFTAERAYRFIQGIREWGVHCEIDAGNALFVIQHALDFHDTARMTVPYELDGERLHIRCSEGVLEAIGHLETPA